MSNAITPGARVQVRCAGGEVVERVAISPVIDGGDFPVVWVAMVDEWEASQREARHTEALPWPCEDVWLAGAREAT